MVSVLNRARAQRGGGGVQERDQPAGFADRLQRPEVHHQRRREAEGDQVDQAVVFLAEVRGGVGPAGHAPVESIHNHRDQQPDGGFVKVSVGGLDDGVKTEEQPGGGEQTRQKIDALSTATLEAVDFAVFVSHSLQGPRPLLPR